MQDIKQVLRSIDAINNINITSQEGTSLRAYYIKGTHWALNRAKEILTENNINFSYNKVFRIICLSELK